jgi:hypothetical protein
MKFYQMSKYLKKRLFTKHIDNMKSQNIIKKAMVILALLVSVTLISCSDKVYSAYSSAGQDTYTKKKNKDVKNTEQSIPSPYTDKHRVKLQEKLTDGE